MRVLLPLALRLSTMPAASPTALSIRLLLVGVAWADLRLLRVLLLAKVRIAMCHRLLLGCLLYDHDCGTK